MADEIAKVNQHTISVIQGHEIGEIIQPLIRDIHLFDTWIAGTTHLEDKAVLKSIHPGDELLLQREDNKFDNAGKILKAKITNIQDQGSWTKVTIGIYLVDL